MLRLNSGLGIRYSELSSNIRERVKRDTRRLSGWEPWIFCDVRCEKARLGSGDGTWTVVPPAIEWGGVVYSVGVGQDIGFDLEMIRRFAVELHAFDPTPIAMKWLEKQKLPEEFHFHPVGLASVDGEVVFELPRPHGISFTIDPTMLQEPSKQTCKGQVRRLDSLLKELGHTRLTVLKIDIEGAEYHIIDDLISAADRIDQLLIEFHHRMLGTRQSVELTANALKRLRANGFRVFDVSARGLEVGLLGPKAVIR